ncbi:hypothetical protein J4230_02310 [Candidatus Woesearchaeota archaeon]|nr:hypothetical protein [Candidatus Woesearchaeota archaeon]
MKGKFIRNGVELDEFITTWSMWLDDDLENDALDLEEWAFWQGYNEEY